MVFPLWKWPYTFIYLYMLMQNISQKDFVYGIHNKLYYQDLITL